MREQIAKQERELVGRNLEADQADVETIGKQELKEYVTFTPKSVLDKEHVKTPEDYAASHAQIEGARDKAQEMVELALEKGIHHALSVLEGQKDSYLTD